MVLTNAGRALLAAQTNTDKIISKSSFWQTHRQHALNTRQVTMLNALLTDFYGKLTTKKWAVMTKCSIPDINDLIEKKMLKSLRLRGVVRVMRWLCDQTCQGFGFDYQVVYQKVC